VKTHIQLFKANKYPDEFAVSKTGSFVDDSMYFLDFSRPIRTLRWLGIKNRWVGFVWGLVVPVIHEGEENGGFVIGIHCSDPYFKDVRALWKERYPSKKPPPARKADELKIIADFAKQFPDDC
jgi:hypothetical protein